MKTISIKETKYSLHNLENYSIKYSTTDAQGQTGKGIGTLPGNVKIEKQAPPPSQSDMNSKLFDPRAMVIYQDVSKENPLSTKASSIFALISLSCCEGFCISEPLYHLHQDQR
jgi:hypothetical protein